MLLTTMQPKGTQACWRASKPAVAGEMNQLQAEAVLGHSPHRSRNRSALNLMDYHLFLDSWKTDPLESRCLPLPPRLATHLSFYRRYTWDRAIRVLASAYP